MVSDFKELANADVTYDILGEDAWGALKRMKGTSAGIVERILYWLNHDPKTLTKEEIHLLRQEITALGSCKIFHPEPWIDTINHALKNPDIHQVEYRGPDPRGVMRFMESMLDCFQILADPNRGCVEVGPLRCTFFISKRSKHSPMKNEVSHPTSLYNLVDEAIFTVVKALQTCGALIAGCPECQKMFLADRINQRFCTTKCLSRSTSRTYYSNLKKPQKVKGNKQQNKKRGRPSQSSKNERGGK